MLSQDKALRGYSTAASSAQAYRQSIHSKNEEIKGSTAAIKSYEASIEVGWDAAWPSGMPVQTAPDWLQVVFSSARQLDHVSVWIPQQRCCPQIGHAGTMQTRYVTLLTALATAGPLPSWLFHQPLPQAFKAKAPEYARVKKLPEDLNRAQNKLTAAFENKRRQMNALRDHSAKANKIHSKHEEGEKTFKEKAIQHKQLETELAGQQQQTQAEQQTREMAQAVSPGDQLCGTRGYPAEMFLPYACSTCVGLVDACKCCQLPLAWIRMTCVL